MVIISSNEIAERLGMEIYTVSRALPYVDDFPPLVRQKPKGYCLGAVNMWFKKTKNPQAAIELGHKKYLESALVKSAETKNLHRVKIPWTYGYAVPEYEPIPELICHFVRNGFLSNKPIPAGHV